MVISVFTGVLRNIFMEPDEFVQEVGIQTFRMFTVLSNILVAIAAALCIPFEIEGLRKRNYHLPRWITICMHTGVTSVTLTLFIALVLLAPEAGYKLMLFQRSNLFLHTQCPILAILLFVFVNTDHSVTFRQGFISTIPFSLYATLYIVEAFIIGEERGGWRDHYQLGRLMPWYYLFFVMYALVFVLSTGLRLGHNRMNVRRKKLTAYWFQTAPEYDKPTIEDAVIALAQERKASDAGGEVVVPRRIIRMFEDKYHSGKPMTELCEIYLKEFLD